MSIGIVGSKNEYLGYKTTSENSRMNEDSVKFSVGREVGESTSSNRGKAIGITTVGGQGYLASYADSSTPANPVIKVGDYEIEVNKVNPQNATQLEMFAWTSYMEDVGLIEKHGMSSYSKMKAYSIQSQYDGVCSGIYDGGTNIEDFWNKKQNWIEIIGNAKKTFANIPSTYTQCLECERLLSYFDSLTQKKTASYEDVYQYTIREQKNDSDVAVCSERRIYEVSESTNYRIVPDNEAACFDIYNKQGERIGAFHYSDIKIRQDSQMGKQFLISEHGTLSYDAMPLDDELKTALQDVMGVETLETEAMQGYTLKTHAGTGIQYLLRDGEEGRGGKVLLQNRADEEKYEALMDTYLHKYPNLMKDKNAANFWASLEIRGLAQHTDNGIISMHFDGMSYRDNNDYKNNWSVMFSKEAYQAVFDWLQNNRGRIEEMTKFSTWQEIFDERGYKYQRIWSDEEEKQGYLNN